MTSAAVSESIMTDQKSTTEDAIVEIVSSIETTDGEQVFETVRSLVNDVDYNYFRIGGYLARISEDNLWDTDTYSSFRDAVEAETGIHYRKAMYLMGIYNDIVESEIPWSKVSMLSWSKLKELSSILTKDNVDEWVAKVMGPPEMTVLQIQEAVKEAKVGSLPSGSEVPEETSKIGSISFKVFPDQKDNIKLAVEKARGEAETDSDGVALDAICTSYLAGGKAKPAKAKPLSKTLEAHTLEQVMEAFEVAFPDVDVVVKVGNL